MFADDANWQDLTTGDWVAVGMLLVSLLILWLGAVERLVRLQREPSASVPWNGLVALFPLVGKGVLSFVAGFAVIGGVRYFFPELIMTEGNLRKFPIQYLLTTEIVSSVLFLLICWAIFRVVLKFEWREMGWQWQAWKKDIGLGVVGFVVFIPVGGVVLEYANKLFAETAEEHPFISLLQKNPGPSVWVSVFVLAVILAPIVEEFVFRVVLQGYLEKWERPTDSVEPATATSQFRLQPYSSVFIASAIFAVLHPWPSSIALFLFAMVLGYLYRQTHRILPCIVAHTCLNLSTVVQLWVISRS